MRHATAFQNLRIFVQHCYFCACAVGNDDCFTLLKMSHINREGKGNACDVYIILWQQFSSPAFCRVNFGLKLLKDYQPVV